MVAALTIAKDVMSSITELPQAQLRSSLLAEYQRLLSDHSQLNLWRLTDSDFFTDPATLREPVKINDLRVMYVNLSDQISQADSHGSDILAGTKTDKYSIVSFCKTSGQSVAPLTDKLLRGLAELFRTPKELISLVIIETNRRMALHRDTHDENYQLAKFQKPEYKYVSSRFRIPSALNYTVLGGDATLKIISPNTKRLIKAVESSLLPCCFNSVNTLHGTTHTVGMRVTFSFRFEELSYQELTEELRRQDLIFKEYE